MNKRSKILIADDKKENIIALMKILSDMDVEVITVSDGNQAVITALHNSFDLILMDVKMPVMDGFEAVKLIKREVKHKYTPVIFLTAAYSDELARVEGINVGAVDFITKPISEDLLIGKVKLLLEIQNNRMELQYISEKLAKSNKKLKDMIFYDSLTGVINRKPFFNLVEQNIYKAKREGRKFAVLFLDLEKFKDINDTYGHDAGDMILKSAANKISNNIRKSDLLGRIGGDEFIVFLDNISDFGDAANIAKKINNSFTEEVQINNRQIHLTVSIGIALYPDDGETLKELLRNSDLAMYSAKKNGKNIYQFYNEKLTENFKFHQALIYAFENNEFSVYYQPILNRKKEIAFFEALLRWNNPAYKYIKIIEIIAVLEKYKMLHKVWKWVLKTACSDIKQFKKKLKNDAVAVSVNLSEKQMEDENIINDFSEIAGNKGNELGDIYLEITERQQIKNYDRIIEVIKVLKNNNCKIIALDDFGSGYSSFSNLIRLPIDIAKIDKFLIDKLDSVKYKTATIDIIKLIKRLDIEVVAEGVETKKQFDILYEAGCDYFQGFYFHKPMPADLINKLLLEKMH